MLVLVVFVSERDKNRNSCLFSEQSYSWLGACVFFPSSTCLLMFPLEGWHWGSTSADTADRPGYLGLKEGGSEMRENEIERGRGKWPFVSDLCLCFCVSLM